MIDMMLNPIRLIGLILVGLGFILYGSEQHRISFKIMGIGIILMSFKWSIVGN